VTGVRARAAGFTVAVTGPTGTLGAGLMPLLEADERVARVVGVARRPFDPASRGWTKTDYRQGDVRDPGVLATAFRGVDVVVHLAFSVAGTAPRADLRAVNVDGTLTVFRAARSAGVARFVYASSVAAYGFHADNPLAMTEDQPVRPAARLFYARQKAELEVRLREENGGCTGPPALYLLRPSIVLGPHTVGAKTLPGPLAPLARLLAGGARRLPVPMAVPALPMQFVHEDDVGRALLLCVLGAGPPGAYNIAGEGVVTAVDVARELGALVLPLPPGPAWAVARAVAALPFLPPFAEWAEALAHPAIMDTTRARTELGWRPAFTGIGALRAALGIREPHRTAPSPVPPPPR